MAEALATRLEIPWRSMHGTLGQDGSHARSNLQARARTLRYTLLLEAAQACNATAIAVGHTQDDLAETVLMRLLRGSGPRGLIAMSPVDAFPLPSAMMLATETPPPLPLILRPLLHARRSDVMIHLTRHALPSATDPSNTNTDFLRVRVRHTLLPQLAEMSPAIVEHLAALSSALDELPTVSPPAAATVDPALTPLLGRSHWTRLREATPGPIPGPMSGERPKGTLLLRAGPGSPPHVISYFRKRNGSPDDNQDP